MSDGLNMSLEMDTELSKSYNHQDSDLESGTTLLDKPLSYKKMEAFLERKSNPYPPLGWKYAWGTYRAGGCTDHANILRLWSKGYKPVPPERHPDVDCDSSVSGFISRRGSVLLEISERDSSIYRNRLDYINSEIEKSPGIANSIRANRSEYVKQLNAPVKPEIEIN